jgi:hypothetical protein
MKMKMEEWPWMVLRGFMLVGMQKRRFHEDQQKHPARQNGSSQPHGNYLISQAVTAGRAFTVGLEFAVSGLIKSVDGSARSEVIAC